MYKAFFNLTRNPFELTPDPNCFVPTKHHDEALASLYYGVRRHKGLVVVTGEVGTGKTLLLRCLLRLLEQSKDVAYAYLFNSTLSPIEFLEYTVADFGLSAAGKNKCELLTELSRFVIARSARQMTTVLIVDEAHQLSPETLEEIRLLSNLETSSEKLMQIMLVGQPELDEKLDSMGLRQLKQRIALRTQLTSLSLDETKIYVEKRLRIAGRDPMASPLFSSRALVKLHFYSQGLPRLINTICENALITAYAKRSPAVTAEFIEEVARDFRLDVPISIEGAGTNKTASGQALTGLPNLYPSFRAPVVSGVRRDAPIIKESKYEPDI
jgi:type II secretory pathway predicted ATPase ExeA